MEVRSTPVRFWHAIVRIVGDFLDEAAFRVALAFAVLVGRVPLEVERRSWNRSLEAPVLIDVFDWTSERRIVSVLVWPSLESSVENATGDHRERVQMVKGVIARGAADMNLTTRFETDYGLRWDSERQVWTTQDGYAFDGRKTHDDAA